MDVSKLYTKAEEAIKRKNYDLAVEMLKNQILKYNPDDVKARKLLRATVLEKYKTAGYPSQGTILSKGLVPKIKMAIGKMMKKWDMVVEEAENYLQFDPKNISVLYNLGEACIEAKYIDTAIAVFESIISKDMDPNHFNSIKKLGNVYNVHKQDLEKAGFYYQRANKLNPTDREAAQQVKDIAAHRTSKVYNAAESSKDLIKDKAKAKELAEDNAILRTDDDIQRAIDRTKAKIEQDPKSKKELKKLGDLYLKLRKFDDAIASYTKLVELDPTLADVKTRIGEARIAKIDFNIENAQTKLKQNPQDKTLQDTLKKFVREKIAVEVEEYTNQVKDQPTNHELRFKLGKALFAAGRYDDAIENFQNAKDPRQKLAIMSYMGQAFLKKKDYQLAEEQFKQALQGLTETDAQYSDLLYNLGLTYESAGKKEDAIGVYTNIYKLDIKFRDVANRLKALKG